MTQGHNHWEVCPNDNVLFRKKSSQSVQGIHVDDFLVAATQHEQDEHLQMLETKFGKRNVKRETLKRKGDHITYCGITLTLVEGKKLE
jgi:hypothetical protein